MTADPPDLRKLFEVWISSERKARLVVFFHENPGIIETLEGLSRRLGMTPDTLSKDIRDHLELGLLKERNLGGKRVFVYDTSARGAMEEMIATLAQKEEERL